MTPEEHEWLRNVNKLLPEVVQALALRNNGLPSDKVPLPAKGYTVPAMIGDTRDDIASSTKKLLKDSSDGRVWLKGGLQQILEAVQALTTPASK